MSQLPPVSPSSSLPIRAHGRWRLMLDIQVELGRDKFEATTLMETLEAVDEGDCVVTDSRLATALMRLGALSAPGNARAGATALKGPRYDEVLDAVSSATSSLRNAAEEPPEEPGWYYAHALTGPGTPVTCVEVVRDRHGDLWARHLGGVHPLDLFIWRGAVPLPR